MPPYNTLEGVIMKSEDLERLGMDLGMKVLENLDEARLHKLANHCGFNLNPFWRAQRTHDYFSSEVYLLTLAIYKNAYEKAFTSTEAEIIESEFMHPHLRNILPTFRAIFSDFQDRYKDRLEKYPVDFEKSDGVRLASDKFLEFLARFQEKMSAQNQEMVFRFFDETQSAANNFISQTRHSST